MAENNTDLHGSDDLLAISEGTIGFRPIRQSSMAPIVRFHQSKYSPVNTEYSESVAFQKDYHMRLTNRIKEAGATGYILLWLLGIPIPILFLIFLLRGCT